MRSGLALLMDVHYPDNANGYGIVLVPGSGWTAPMSPDADPLKSGMNRTYLGGQAMLEAGYTVFSINHRAAPDHFYPAPVEDAQRAVRFVRYNAVRFGIDPDRIGALGGSSGGHLALMLAVMDNEGQLDDSSEINRVSAKVQTVAAVFPPTDFVKLARGGRSYVPLFQHRLTSRRLERNPDSEEERIYRAASPITYVTDDDPPVMLIHGDQDTVVPFSQSEVFKAALEQENVDVELIRMPGGGHGPSIISRPDSPDYFGPLVDWFDRYLKN
jgi:acetyl esterase/lipase